MIINHNLSAMNTQRASKINNWGSAKNIAALSSGMRINKAGDDASGLAVSEKMRSQIRGLNQASRNASDGISFIQTAEGFLQETTDVLQRLRELAVQASNGIYTSEDRMQIQVEVSQLVDELDRVASHAQFNGLNMLTGRFAASTGENSVTSSMWLHIGANMDQREQVFIGTMTSSALGVRQVATGNIMSISTPEQANRNIGVLDQALKLSTNRGLTLVPTRTDWKWLSEALTWALKTCRHQNPESETLIWLKKLLSSQRTRSSDRPAMPCLLRLTRDRSRSFSFCSRPSDLYPLQSTRLNSRVFSIIIDNNSHGGYLPLR